ncbi:MAG: DUF4202 domain-containing protein [Bacteroidetes bacterium]|nr:DUF4202 domain-containing protein [Bacteroidota bacterium]
MTSNSLSSVLAAIDEENSKDPNAEIFEGKSFPKELLYSERMYKRLLEFHPSASEELTIAARAQHICRWKLPRESYPMNRVGYLLWREELKKFHSKTTATILENNGYTTEFINRVSFLIEKKAIKKDAESQVMEDTICLVFLEYYLEPFVEKHISDADKLKNIIVKTWNKMSDNGHAEALKISYTNRSLQLIKEALGL